MFAVSNIAFTSPDSQIYTWQRAPWSYQMLAGQFQVFVVEQPDFVCVSQCVGCKDELMTQTLMDLSEDDAYSLFHFLCSLSQEHFHFVY